MTDEEIVILARYVRALCPAQKFDEYTPDAWSDVLRPYELADAREAAAAIARRQPWVAPAEIIAEVKRARGERLANFVYEPANRDESAQEFQQRYRNGIRAVASGQVPAPSSAPALAGGPHPLVAKQIEGFGREVPEGSDGDGEEQPVRRRSGRPGTVRCPKCSAPVGRPCRASATKRRSTPHPERIRMAAGKPFEEPEHDEQAVRERALAFLADYDAQGGAA
ncbi:zinc finger domain-containing protein [Streptomyces xiamenensis]